jgi:hypothetical protein
VAPWENAVVSLADPPAWLLLEAPRSTTPGSPAPKATTHILKPQMEELGLAPDLSRLPESVLELIRHGNGTEIPLPLGGRLGHLRGDVPGRLRPR